MVKRIGTTRTKTRHKLKKSHRRKGKISITNYLRKFNPGEKVILKAEPAVHEGMYHPNHHGKQGIIKGKQGDCYKVQVNDHSKQKVLIIHPVHLRKRE